MKISAEWLRSLGVRLSDRLVTGVQYHGDKEEGQEDKTQDGSVEKGDEGPKEKENRREGVRERQPRNVE